MNAIEKLRARLSELKTEIDAILDAGDNQEGGLLTDEQDAKCEELMAEHARVRATLDRKLAAASIAEEMEASPGRRTSPRTPGAGPEISDVHDRREDDGMCGYASAQEFAKDIHSAATGLRKPSPKYHAYMDYPQMQAAATTFQSAASGADSGVNVPPAISQRVFELMFAEGSLLNLVDSEPTTSNAVEKERDEATPWGTTGVVAKWEDEVLATALTQQKVDPNKPDLVKINDLTALVPAKNSLLDDAPRLENKLTRHAGMRLRWKAEDTILYGSGAGQPYGYFNHGSLVSVAKESGQAADTIVAANVAKMFSRLLVTPGGSPRWLIQNDALPQLMQMTLGDNSIYMPPATGFINAPGGFLFGIPVLITQHAKTVGDQGDIHLIDPMGYYFPRRTAGIDFASSMHLWFDQNVTAFKWVMRFGGQPHLSAAVSPANGSNTLSHFVVLDARA